MYAAGGAVAGAVVGAGAMYAYNNMRLGEKDMFNKNYFEVLIYHTDVPLWLL